MSTIFGITNEQHGEQMSQVLATWAQDRDVCLVSRDNHVVWTSLKIIKIISPWIREIIRQVGSQDVGISVPASHEAIEAVIEIFHTDTDNRSNDKTYSQEVYDCLFALSDSNIVSCLQKSRHFEENNDPVQENTEEDNCSYATKMEENALSDDKILEYNENDAFKISEIEEIKDVLCTICNQTYATKANLKQHHRRKHDDRVLFCESCDYTTSTQDKLKIHQLAKHDGMRFPCDLCEFVCSYKSYLKVHIENKHEGIKYPCNYCDYKSTDKVYIRNHILSQHEGITYSCDAEECQYIGKSKAGLKKHKWRKHEASIDIFCTECQYKTYDESLLKKHILVEHKGVRFECTLCDYKARSKLNLKTHKDNVHAKIKHPCDICGYQASTRNFLYIHKQTKHGNKRFYCDKCKYVTTSNVYLRQHKKRSCLGPSK